MDVLGLEVLDAPLDDVICVLVFGTELHITIQLNGEIRFELIRQSFDGFLNNATTVFLKTKVDGLGFDCGDEFGFDSTGAKFE